MSRFGANIIAAICFCAQIYGAVRFEADTLFVPTNIISEIGNKE